MQYQSYHAYLVLCKEYLIWCSLPIKKICHAIILIAIPDIRWKIVPDFQKEDTPTFDYTCSYIISLKFTAMVIYHIFNASLNFIGLQINLQVAVIVKGQPESFSNSTEIVTHGQKSIM